MFVYLDESGNLTKDKEHYFIVGSYTVGDPRRISKAFRKWQRTKFPRKLKGQSEVKFNNPTLDDKLRLKTIKFLANQDIRIFYTFLKKENIPREYRKKGKVHETGLLYTEIVGETLELYLPIAELEFRVFRDRKTLRGVNLAQFNEILNARLLPKLPARVILQIAAEDSSTHPQIQVADWICGALARYYENKKYGKEFYEILKNNIVRSKELFEKYWEEKWK